MASPENLYVGNGATVLYSFTFPYLETDDIKVSVDGTPTTAYTLANATTIQFNAAPANGAAIRIYRVSDSDALEAEFFPGSSIRAQDLNANFTQGLYLTQEAVRDSGNANTTADSAVSLVNSAIATANTAETNSNTAISTANTAVSTANSAVSTANSAVSTANSAVSTANTALSTANDADNKATLALDTVAGTIQYVLINDVASIPATPDDGDAIQVADATGIEGFSPISGLPGGFIGDSGLFVRLQYNAGAVTWEYRGYGAVDPDDRYAGVNTNTGTAAAPSIAFGPTDLNTGIYSPGADQLALSTNGVQRINIEADGDINIDSGGVFYDATNNRLAIGTTSPSQLLHIQSADTARIQLTAATNNTSRIHFGDTDSAIIGQFIYDHGNDSLQIVVNSGEKARIDSSGRLLVGTSTARSNLFNGSVTAVHQVEASALNTVEFLGVRNLANSTGADIVLAKSRGSAAGSNVIVQSDDLMGSVAFMGSDGSEFVLGARITAEVDGTPGADDMPGRLVFSTNPGSPATGPTERMRIASNGGVGIGNLSPSYAGGQYVSNAKLTLHAAATVNNSNVPLEIYAGSSSNTRFCASFSNGNGVVGSISTAGSATSYNTSSDYRLKENVAPVTDGITRLQQLKPSRFNFIADPDKTVDGFLAHEVQAIVPEATTGEKDAVDDDGKPVYQGIDQSKLVPLLTAALQEAVARIETLEAKVAALENPTP